MFTNLLNLKFNYEEMKSVKEVEKKKKILNQRLLGSSEGKLANPGIFWEFTFIQIFGF